MSVYAPLQDHLKHVTGSRWKARFKEIEHILRRPLPKSAYKYQAWWANQSGKGHVQAAAWRDIGWRAVNLDLERQTVEFELSEQSRSAAKDGTDALLRKAALYAGTTDKAVLYREALTAFVQREAARRLAGRGGKSPQLQSAPRRRDEDA